VDTHGSFLGLETVTVTTASFYIIRRNVGERNLQMRFKGYEAVRGEEKETLKER